MATDRTEFLIIGSGIAGLRAAIGLANTGRVLILTKAEPSEGNTGYAQGGIAAAIAEDDSPVLHAADTIRAGDGLCDEEAIRVLVEEGVTYVKELLDWGARFDRNPDGRPALGREAAHSVRRVLHAGDATGREIGRVLWQRVCGLPTVSTIHHALVTELIVEEACVTGVRYFDQQGHAHEVRARQTLIATGGAGRVFRETTNPPVASGDGVALAFHAGARVSDLEFVQFHPTALNCPDAPRFLISEALRGEGARLVNGRGEPFMTNYHHDGDLAPRDVVARSIVREMERSGGQVFLTLAHLDAAYVRRRFPTIADTCARVGLDLATDPIPVGPAAHYMMGGVDTDEWGRTSLAGLLAAGEVACTGVHGANRLASNSLLEGLVFGARAANMMPQPPSPARLRPNRRLLEGSRGGERGDLEGVRRPRSQSESAPPVPNLYLGDGSLDVEAIRDLMWRSVGLFRSGGTLVSAVAGLDAAYASEVERVQMAPPEDGVWRQFNLLTLARLIAGAALRREESRGGHFRDDFPDRNDREWKVHLCETRVMPATIQVHEGPERRHSLE